MSESSEGRQGAQEAADGIRARRITALRAVRRRVGGNALHAPVGDRLRHLLEHGPDAYDLDQPADLYGDRIVETLEERVAGLLGKEGAVFFPTGTMAQQVALRCWAGRTGNATVALHPLSHPEVHERDALGAVSGLRTVHPTMRPGLPNAQEVRDLGEPFGTLMLELPLREAGFVLPSWQELTEVVAAAREREAVVHFDGARLWESVPHLGHPLDEVAGLADSVYVSFYKSLGGLGGAVLAGPGTLTEEARIWRHRYGGQIFHQFPTVLSALIGLDRELPRLPSYVAHARVVADAIREGFAATGLPWARVHPQVPHTHQFQVWLPYEAEPLEEAALRQAEEDGTCLFWHWTASGAPGTAFTEVTVNAPGLEWTADDVKEAVARFVARLPG
ncbi:threonine aldolase [Streptomyces sulfonofaciens]|uniref:Threonine aldolase n=1 Tax=Streptomyces sulfonofaciens TaxID=68272 RepID=A0A919GK76_9ACTN|nr:beta-eliminating lyase-related protein [Streptomyces sulfonofaciens]GHH85441.1 threonine aldolase [Streptomyces sulfonofaciens]